MKTFMNYFIVALLILITTGIIQAQNEMIRIGEIKNGTPIITYDIELLKDAFEDSWNDGTTVNDIVIEGNGPIYNIVAYGENNGQSMLRGFKLSINVENGISYLNITNNEVLNSCLGNCCTSCSFTRDINGKITGCSCNKGCPEGSQSYCEHSIEEYGSRIIYEYLINHSN